MHQNVCLHSPTNIYCIIFLDELEKNLNTFLYFLKRNDSLTFTQYAQCETKNQKLCQFSSDELEVAGFQENAASQVV